MKLVRISKEAHQQAKVLAAAAGTTLEVVLEQAVALFAGVNGPAFKKFFSGAPADEKRGG